MSDVTSLSPADVRLWVSLDVHKLSIVAATLPPAGGKPDVSRIETTEKAIRRFIDRLGGPAGLAVCYEAGPGGYALWRLLTRMGVACDVVAPSLVPVRAGDRVKTDRRDAKKLVTLHRAGLLRYVHPPTPQTEGLRDLLRCRDDLRCARTAARHRVLKALLRHGRVFREGKTAWTLTHRRWVNAQRLPDALAQLALEQMLIHLDGIERQLDALDRQLEQIAASGRWAEQVQTLTRFRGIATLTALGLIAEIGDFARFGHPRELASWLGITPSEYSSGDQQHRGHITKTGNRHARRLLIEAAWHYRHAPRRPAKEPQPDQRAWQAQVRLHHRYRHLTEHGKRSTVVNVAIARELLGFLWAAMTNQPLTTTSRPQEVAA
ncbi:MAG: IS110 family transposase [Actinobacteria bacterium]|nr:IS110 family transposase [Actinomycetota bacterium]MCA1699957.1 IS110 family transposase [Actinomycetota bacterium]